jgi:hypothetical protein
VAAAAIGLAVAAIVQWQRESDSTGSAETRLDKVNEKRALHGLATFAPDEVDLSRPNIFLTPAEIATQTVGPSPTPWVPACGPQEGGVDSRELIQTYGELITGCELFSNVDWLITTRGRPGEPGVIAILSCPSTDAECLAGRPPAFGTTWQIYPAPLAGAVKILLYYAPDDLVINNGGTQMCFSLRTRSYAPDGCIPAIPMPPAAVP